MPKIKDLRDVFKMLGNFISFLKGNKYFQVKFEQIIRYSL